MASNMASNMASRPGVSSSGQKSEPKLLETNSQEKPIEYSTIMSTEHTEDILKKPANLLEQITNLIQYLTLGNIIRFPNAEYLNEIIPVFFQGLATCRTPSCALLPPMGPASTVKLFHQ